MQFCFEIDIEGCVETRFCKLRKEAGILNLVIRAMCEAIGAFVLRGSEGAEGLVAVQGGHKEVPQGGHQGVLQVV